MHELSITQQVLDIALNKAKEANAQRVNRINLVIGEISSVIDDSVQFYFDFLSRDTMAQGAQLSFRRIQLQVKCWKCGECFSPDGGPWECPKCHNQGAEIVHGNEFYIDSIEVD